MKAGLTALAAALALGLTGCDGSLLDVQGGNVRFVLSSPAAPAAGVVAEPSADAETPSATVVDGPQLHGDRERNPYFESANVTFSAIHARNFDGQLVDAGMDLPATIDVVTMEDGRTVTLPDGDLPPGTYDQVVVVMTAFQGVTYDGTTITIDPPGGGWTAIIPICPFDVVEGETAVVGLEISLTRSLSWRDNRYHFKPVFQCDQGTEEEAPTEG
jgi:hypothetical protein